MDFSGIHPTTPRSQRIIEIGKPAAIRRTNFSDCSSNTHYAFFANILKFRVSSVSARHFTQKNYIRRKHETAVLLVAIAQWEFRRAAEVPLMSYKEVKIGCAPDYVIHIGKELCYHCASVSITIFGRPQYQRMTSNQSLAALVFELKQICSVANFTADTQITWITGSRDSGSFTTQKVSVEFIYSCSNRLPQNITMFLSGQFINYFRTN